MDRRIGAMMARNGRPDTNTEIAWRRRHNAACEQARVDRLERYPDLTAENVNDALRFQEDRIKALMEEGR